MKYKAVDYFWRAGVLQLTRFDSITARNAHDRYGLEDPRWDSSQEGICFGKLGGAMENENVDDFTLALSQYSEIKTLDDWSVGHLRSVQEWLKSVSQDLNSPKGLGREKITLAQGGDLDDDDLC